MKRVEEALDAIRKGQFVLVMDDEDRENEGDLIIAAEMVDEQKIAFMVRHTSGLVCLPVLGERLDELELPLMVSQNTDSHLTAFTVSVDYGPGVSTGISAADRAATIKAFVDSSTRPSDLARPGHIFPLRYQEGGVLVRPGHTEAAVDLARMAGLYPAGVLCEVVNDDGTMARGSDLDRFAKEHDILMVTIADLIKYRWRTERLVERRVEATIPTAHGDFAIYGFRDVLTKQEHVALVMGDVDGASDVLTRLHSECLTGDVFGSKRCDCGTQLHDSLRAVAAEGRGVVVYNRAHEGRGIGLVEKLKAYRLQDEGRDTVDANIDLGFPADAREYGIDAQILLDLGVQSVRLLTNNPAKCAALAEFGVQVDERVGLTVAATDENRGYLAAKASRMGHLIELNTDE
ncbi:MAG: bifunctional 3,4-dihydroxy-2-butanone-4-phosphate synthase/GTP cyclohydrolase II [Acidimicrobiia bacterium]|nr:bifunctional 3,4-dihydroxy-2-butanone-4-phosphate synthase/GTP cyclohydrolase II [Acidimicrobiia bacterium]